MAKLNRLPDFINTETLPHDIMTAERGLKRSIVGEPRYAAAVIGGIKANILETAKCLFEEELYEKVEAYKMLYGERPTEGYEDWDAGIDEACEEATTPYVDVLSQNWLGTDTIDTHLHEAEEFDRIVKSFATEVYKQLTDKAPGEEIIGAAKVDIAEYVALLSSPTIREANAEDEQKAFDIAVQRIAATNAVGYNPIELYDFLDNATDSDDGLAFGATAQLLKSRPIEDITPFVRALQGYRKANGGKDAPQKLLDLVVTAMSSPAYSSDEELEDIVSDAVAPLAVDPTTQPPEGEYFTQSSPAVAMKLPKGAGKATKAEKVAKGKVVAKNQKKVEKLVGTGDEIIPPGILKDLQEALGNDDTTMAGILGVSRQSWSNYATGKREFTSSEEQRDALKEALRLRYTAAMEMAGRF